MASRRHVLKLRLARENSEAVSMNALYSTGKRLSTLHRCPGGILGILQSTLSGANAPVENNPAYGSAATAIPSQTLANFSPLPGNQRISGGVSKFVLT
jgi:hypothetical protein